MNLIDYYNNEVNVITIPITCLTNSQIIFELNHVDSIDIYHRLDDKVLEVHIVFITAEGKLNSGLIASFLIEDELLKYISLKCIDTSTYLSTQYLIYNPYYNKDHKHNVLDIIRLVLSKILDVKYIDISKIRMVIE